MEKVMSANRQTGNLLPGKSLLSQSSDILPQGRLTVQQALSKWYSLLKTGVEPREFSGSLFEGTEKEAMLKSLQTDFEMIPGLLMDELINHNAISDKGQYIRMVQALLINLSDILPESEMHEQLCTEAETVLQFMQDFFYRHFDFDYRATAYCLQQLKNSFQLKLDYWKIKLRQSPLVDALQECMNEKLIVPEDHLTFRKVAYLKNLFHQLESGTTIINDEYVREFFIYYNFNAAYFIEYEKSLIKSRLNDGNSMEENIALLRNEQMRIVQLKVKPGSSFEINQPCIRKQLNDWITNELKQIELNDYKKANKDLQLDPEIKIQTSLSVAKLAVLIRLMVVDKIIINKSVAPMLRSAAKLFTTLQKDEISFGSLETKYHAPDKATLNIIKEMLQKWVVLIGKL